MSVSTLPSPTDYVCINCCEPGAVGEIHIYSADNEFERSLTILEALGEIFTSSNLIVAQEAKVMVFMCSKCAEAISYMYQYYNNLLQLSISSGYICKLISQIEAWHHEQQPIGKEEYQGPSNSGNGETEFIGFGAGDDDEGSYDFHPLEETEEESTVYDTPMTEEVVTTKRKVGRPRTKPFVQKVLKRAGIKRRPRPIIPKVKKPFGYGSIKERRLIRCSFCPEKFLMNLRVHEHILSVHEGKEKCQCHKCGFSYYPELIKFETHKCISDQQITVPVAEQPLVCEVCGVRYGGDRLMLYHMEQVHAQENVRYKCHQCNTNTATRHTLHRHIERAHSKVRTYLCGCGEEFEQKQGLTDHLPCERMLTCAVCKKVFTRKGLLLSHQRYKHRPPPPQFKCPVCEKPHFSQLKFERHVRSHNAKPEMEWPLSHGTKTMPQGNFPCEFCGKTYKLKAYLLEHIDFTHPNERGTTTRLLEDSIKSMTEENSESFSSEVTLIEYVEVPGTSEETTQRLDVDPIRKYECSLCLKRYKTRTHLANHYKTHTGEYRNLGCPIEGCGHKVRGKAKLEAHIRMKHPETIPEEEQYRWQCETCGKFCISRDHLRKHTFIHQNPKERERNQRRVPCPIPNCGIQVANKSNLEAHISSKHPDSLPEEDRNRWKCDVCEKTFGAKKSLDRHKTTHLELDARLACETCGLTFKRRYVLNQHMARKHGEGVGLPEEEDGSAILIMEVDEPDTKVEIATLGTLRRSTLKMNPNTADKPKEAETIQVWKCRLCQKYFSVNLSKEEHMRARHTQRY